MRLIYSRQGPETQAEVTDADLVELYRHPAPGAGTWLRSNFVTSLDGSIQGLDGRSGGVSTASDHHVFALHRAHCDAVVVGAGTARTERYRAVDLLPWQRQIRANEGLSAVPALVVFSATLNLDPAMAARPDEIDQGEVLVVTGDRPDERRAERLTAAGIEILRVGGSNVALAAAVELLSQRGYRRLLCEGGPRLHRDLLAANLVDSLSLTLAPKVVGGPGSRTTVGAPLHPPRDFELDFVLVAPDQTLFTQYVRSSGSTPPATEASEPG
jgi:riboflavin biosynthesis pyrimidine reductase